MFEKAKHVFWQMFFGICFLAKAKAKVFLFFIAMFTF